MSGAATISYLFPDVDMVMGPVMQPEPYAAASASLPHRHFRDRVLEFPLRLADHERQAHRFAQPPEIFVQMLMHAVERRHRLAVSLEAADPGVARRMLLQSGVG